MINKVFKNVLNICKFIVTVIFFMIVGILITFSTTGRETDNKAEISSLDEKLENLKIEDENIKKNIESLTEDISSLENKIKEKEGTVIELQSVSNSYN